MLGFFGMERRVPGIRRLVDAAQEGEDWFAPFEGAAPPWFNLLLAMERVADTCTGYVASVVAGLAQTRRYSEALIRYLEPHLTDEEVRWRVDLRASRQQNFNRVDVPTVHWIVEEVMLRHRRLGADIVREQIAHLGHLVRRPSITGQVMPTDRGPHEMLRAWAREIDAVPYAEGLAVGGVEGPLDRRPRPAGVAHHRRLFGLGTAAASRS